MCIELDSSFSWSVQAEKTHNSTQLGDCHLLTSFTYLTYRLGSLISAGSKGGDENYQAGTGSAYSAI